MNNEMKSGLYLIDDDFKVLYFNDAVKEMYPDIETGQHCYEAITHKECPCSYCPLNNLGNISSFYNHECHEWIHAQAAKAELPGFGKCFSVMITRNVDDDPEALSLNGAEGKKAAREFADENDCTGMIGGYCEEGFPLFFANEKMVKMLGYDDYDDFCKGIGGMVANTIHPDDMAQVAEDIGPEYYAGLEYETIYRMPRKNGTWFWTADKGRVVEAEDGRLAIVSFCTDITDTLRKQDYIEKQNHVLQQQNRFMEFINSGMPGGYHRCADEEGYPFLYVSDKLLEMIGYTRDEVRELFDDKFLNLVHPDDRIHLIRSCNNASAGQDDGEISVHYRLVNKNKGYIRVMDTSCASEYNGEHFYQGVVIDISKEESMQEHIEFLEQVQTALQEALVREQLYREQLDHMQNEILDSISCGVLAYSLPGHELLIVNDAAKKMIGCGENDDPIQELKKFLLERVVEEDKSYVHGAKNKLEKCGDMVLQDYSAVVNGERIDLHANIKRLEDADGKTYILVTLLDNTAQSRLTTNLIKERKAYRDALANGCEFNFFFDVTAGMITEEFITSHGFNLIKALGVELPISFDELLEKYVEKYSIEFSSEEMKKYFTCKGLIDVYERGITNAITEYYNPVSDMFFRVNSLLSIDDETGHIHAAVLADDISEIRKKDKLQQEALKAAYDEMNVRINAILDGISGGLKIVDIEKGYRYEYISEGAAQLQGYTVDEFLEKYGKRVTSNIYGDEGEPALAEANRQIAENGSYAVKYRVPHKDGTVKWVIDRGKYVEDVSTGRKYLYILMQDITDLENRSNQVINVLSMQRQMAEALGSGIFAYTIPQYEVLILNQEAKKMFELMGAEEKNFGKDIISRVISDDMPVMRDAIKRLLKPGDNVEYIFHTDSAANGRRTFKCSTKLLRFDDDQRYIISAITDITEQELTEKRLDEERRQYRNALAYSSESIFTIDLTDGYISEPILSKDGNDILRPIGVTLPITYDLLASAWFSHKRIVSDSENVDVVKSRERLLEYYNSGNTLIDIEYHVPESGKYYRVLILLYNIGGHIKANFILSDVTLSKHEEKQRISIIESLGKVYLALYHISFKDGTLTVLKANDDIADVLSEKCTIDDFYNIYFRNFIEDEYVDKIKSFLDIDNIKSTLMDSEYMTTEFKRKGLGWCRMTLVAAERDVDGVVTSIVFAGNVIEKQKVAELAQQEALRAAVESANIANSAKTDFLANMSHDIRTPMNAIIGMTAIAGTHIDDKERVADCLSKINISSKHLLGIINEVLDMSKIESGKMELQEEEFNLPELIDNLLNMSKPDVEAKQHRLTVTIRGIEHENVIGDSQRIQQVFMNLMSNAIKYTPGGGGGNWAIYQRKVH